MQNLKDEAIEKIEHFQNILKLVEKYPSLRINKDRWSVERYTAKEISPFANDLEISHSCGCCDDAVVYARPYISEFGIKIYGEPLNIGIGELYDGFDIPWDNWELEIIKNGYNDIIIEKIKEHFKEQEIKKEKYDSLED